MSQKGVEALLGRMVTDGEFRDRFYQEPAASCIAEAMEVTTRELEAVLALDQARLAEFSKLLDARIVRAHLNGVSHPYPKPDGVPEARLDTVPPTAARARQYRVR